MHTLPCRFLLVAILGVLPPALAAQCVHLGELVNCPPGIPEGSESLFFNPDGGITWTGNLSSPPGACCTPFEPPVPGGGGGGGDGGSDGGNFPDDSLGHLALTAGSNPVDLADELLGEPGAGDDLEGFDEYLEDIDAADGAEPLDGDLLSGGNDGDAGDVFEQEEQQELHDPGTVRDIGNMSWVDRQAALQAEFAIFDLNDAEGYRRYADELKKRANAWRELAGDARRDAERNRQRADEARRDGREADARGWDEEAARDEARADERDAEATAIDGEIGEERAKEQQARDRARAREDEARRVREDAERRVRERAEAERRKAEAEAERQRAEREARRAREQAARDREWREQEQRWREQREREQARDRARADAERRQAEERARSEREAQRQQAEARRNAQRRQRWDDDKLPTMGGKGVELGRDTALNGAGEIISEVSEGAGGKLAGGALGGAADLLKIKDFGEAADDVVERSASDIEREKDLVDRLSDPTDRTDPHRLQRERWDNTKRRAGQLAGAGM